MDLSQYRCLVPDRSSETTGTCDAIVKQTDLDDHLASHGIKPAVNEVLTRFILHKAAYGRPRAPVAKVEDHTEPMFDREDFR